MPITATKPKAIHVGMTQFAIGHKSDTLTSVLGSCVGIALYDAFRQIGGYAHVVLADSAGRSGAPAKFVDTAIPHLVSELCKAGADKQSLVAKIAGGASMFDSSSSIQIGADNVNTALSMLSQVNIPLLGKHVGGMVGRKVALECDTGILTVETFGSPAMQL